MPHLSTQDTHPHFLCHCPAVRNQRKVYNYSITITSTCFPTTNSMVLERFLSHYFLLVRRDVSYSLTFLRLAIPLAGQKCCLRNPKCDAHRHGSTSCIQQCQLPVWELQQLQTTYFNVLLGIVSRRTAVHTHAPTHTPTQS